MKTIGYVRVSSVQQEVDSQRQLLLKYAQQNRMLIDEFIECSVSSRLSPKERRIDELLNVLCAGDILLVSELSRLGRNMLEVLNIINSLSEQQVKIVFVRQPELSTTAAHGKLLLILYSYFSEAERDFIASRTRAGLDAARSRGVRLGRPKGSKNLRTSLFDPHRAEIIRFLKQGVPVNTILRIVNGERQKDEKLSYTAIRYYITNDYELVQYSLKTYRVRKSGDDLQ